VLRGASVPSEQVPAHPTMTAVVCTHDVARWPALVRAVESLRAQTVPLDEILVVIDHNDHLRSMAEELTGVRVVANVRARGLSGARNTAVGEVTSDVVAFLDDDAWAAPDWAARMLAVYEDRSVSAVGGAIEPAWTTGRPAWFPEEFDWVVGCTYRGLPTVRSTVRNVIGANMSFRRSVLEAAGGFDELLGRVGGDGAGCEETELCIRVVQRDPEALIIYEPTARVQHEVPAERATFAYFAKRCRAEGRSKATVSRLVGAGDGLASERTYATRTLPVGVARGLGRLAVLDPSGGARAASVVAGLAMVGSSYLRAGRAAAPQGDRR
jgi:glycosyltransferase involved in cell wall biosynthesis